MNILVIPEDSRSDGYILHPLFSRLFSSIGKPHAKVRVCANPILQGVDQALRVQRIMEIVTAYPMVSLFILCVDRDSDENRHHRLRTVENSMPDGRVLLAEHAWQELEAWLLAGLELPNQWRWNEIRAETSVKEVYFEPLARQRGFADGPGGGRKQLGTKSARNIERILARCPELMSLRRRIETSIASLNI